MGVFIYACMRVDVCMYMCVTLCMAMHLHERVCL